MKKKFFLFLLIGISGLVLAFLIPSILEAQAPAWSFWANPTTVASGGSTTLNWNAPFADACQATVGPSQWTTTPISTGDKTVPIGSQTISNITSGQAYTLRCWWGLTSDSKTVTVTVTAVSTCPSECTCRWDCLYPGEAGRSEYTCVSEFEVCCCPVGPPTVNFWADSTNISFGDSTILHWSSTNTDNCVAFGGPWSGSKGVAGNEPTGPLTSTQTYVIRCHGGGGSIEANVTINVGAAPGWIRIENPLTADTFGELVDKLINFIFTIAIVLAPLMIIIAGFLFVTSGGKPEQVAKAKTIITWTIIGFIIILLAKGIVALIDQILGVS
ncbi:MAG: pilin [Candidatus Paceibacterales bacterium]